MALPKKLHIWDVMHTCGGVAVKIATEGLPEAGDGVTTDRIHFKDGYTPDPESAPVCGTCGRALLLTDFDVKRMCEAPESPVSVH